MRSLILVSIVVFFLMGCETSPVYFSSWEPPSTTSVTNIELHHKTIKRQKCVRATKTRVRNCHSHNENESCNAPGDTLVFEWKNRTIDRPFKITMKAGFSDPFVPHPDCSQTANVVVCVIDPETPKNTFYDYNVIVDPEIPNCDLDPRFLIY